MALKYNLNCLLRKGDLFGYSQIPAGRQIASVDQTIPNSVAQG